jgi:transcriptional regulator with XRE-family HTH domain
MHKNPAGTFAERLRFFMERDHLTVEQFAATIGVSKAAVMKWRHGQVPNAGHLRKIARQFNRTMEDLLVGTTNEGGGLERWMKVPLGQVPANVLKEMGLLKTAGSAIGFSNAPGWRDTVQAVAMEITANAELKKNRKKGVDILRKTVNSAGMSNMEILLARLKRVLGAPGKKAELARALKVAPPRISEWLSGSREPGGEYTLQLLSWVEQQERQ